MARRRLMASKSQSRQWRVLDQLLTASASRCLFLCLVLLLSASVLLYRSPEADLSALWFTYYNSTTGRVNATAYPSLQVQRRQAVETTVRQVYFLNRTHQLSKTDGFSASWLQRVEEFMTQPIDRVTSCEGASFSAFEHGREGKLRMTVDWTDFAVEHLSKWWKAAKIFRENIVFQTTIGHLDSFIYRATGKLDPSAPLPLLHPTLAVIAFQPYSADHRSHKEKAWRLTITSLAATLESLRRIGFGRVVVVGIAEDDDSKVVYETFQYLRDILEGRPTNYVKFNPQQQRRRLQQSTNNANAHQNPIVTKIGTMEVAYAEVSAVYAVTRHVTKNVPKATLLNLRDAFRLHQENASPTNTSHVQWLQTWFGEKGASYWKYVYLTEPDTILNFRPSTIPQLKATVDDGNVLVPHRLQPFPHESDMRGVTHENYLKESDGFQTVLQLDHHAGDACCDEFIGLTAERPGMFEKCGNFWWTCGFVVKGDPDPHKRIRPYKLIRLTQGTGIVSLAANEHARRCTPTHNAECVVPEEYKLTSIPPTIQDRRVLLSNDNNNNNGNDKGGQLKLLYIVTSVAEFDTGRRKTVLGRDRYLQTLVPVVTQGVLSMVQDFHYDVDVYLICHYTLSEQRVQILRQQLPLSTRLSVWNDATPLHYPKAKENVGGPHVLMPITRALARQHRYVIKDQFFNYDVFVNFEDDMLIQGHHVQQYLNVTHQIEQLTRQAPRTLPSMTFTSQQEALNSFNGILSERQLQRIIPGFIRVEVASNATAFMQRTRPGKIPVLDQIRVDPRPCCLLKNASSQQQRPVSSNNLFLWETHIQALGVRQMPALVLDNNDTSSSTLDWVVLLRGNNPAQMDYEELIGDYWSGRDGDYDNHRPDPTESVYANNQGGWMATRRQLFQWHAYQCLGGFLPPFAGHMYPLDGMTYNVEYWSGGGNLVGRLSCNLQRIIPLDPVQFSRHLLYHTSNNKQKQLKLVRGLFSHVDTLLGQLCTVKERAEQSVAAAGK